MPKHGFSHAKPTPAQLLTAFEARFIPEPMSGCWLWIGNTLTKRGGYGVFTCRPDRLAWHLYRGGVPANTHILHRCDNPLCVNPDHLFLGDQTTNMKDKCSKSRQDRGESHGMAKLTSAAVLKIRSSDAPGAELARRYGVTHATICDIRAKRSWSHI